MSEIIVERHDRVVHVTLNRPTRSNGITVGVVEDLIAAFEEIPRTSDDRALILRGRGDAFCSGMDLDAPVEPDPLTFMRRVGHLCACLHNLPIPTIAAVRGPAIGFGSSLALCCDLVLADETALFGEIFSERGLSIDGGGSWSLPRRVGMTKAKELVFLAQRVSGTEAAEIGLVNRVTPTGELDALVDDWSTQLASGPRQALALMKSLLNAAPSRSFDEALDAEMVAQSLTYFSPDAREGVRAFAQRRSPNFTNG